MSQLFVHPVEGDFTFNLGDFLEDLNAFISIVIVIRDPGLPNMIQIKTKQKHNNKKIKTIKKHKKKKKPKKKPKQTNKSNKHKQTNTNKIYKKTQKK